MIKSLKAHDLALRSEITRLKKRLDALEEATLDDGLEFYCADEPDDTMFVALEGPDVKFSMDTEYVQLDRSDCLLLVGQLQTWLGVTAAN